MTRLGVQLWTAREGSTRALGLIRAALGLLTWVRFADEVALFQSINWAHALFGLGLTAAALMTFVGFMSRAAVLAQALLLACGYFVLGPYAPGWDHHHVYLLMASSFLLALTPCGRSFSVDRLRALRRAARTGAPPPEERGPLWAQPLLGLQLSAVYFWGAVDKTNWGFLSGERLEQIMIAIHAGRPLETLLLWQPALVAASVAVVVLEYYLAVAIHIRRQQPVALSLGLALHAAFYVLLPVKTFSGTMIVLYLAVLDPDAVHRFIDRLQGHEPSARRI